MRWAFSPAARFWRPGPSRCWNRLGSPDRWRVRASQDIEERHLMRQRTILPAAPPPDPAQPAHPSPPPRISAVKTMTTSRQWGNWREIGAIQCHLFEVLLSFGETPQEQYAISAARISRYLLNNVINDLLLLSRILILYKSQIHIA